VRNLVETDHRDVMVAMFLLVSGKLHNGLSLSLPFWPLSEKATKAETSSMSQYGIIIIIIIIIM